MSCPLIQCVDENGLTYYSGVYSLNSGYAWTNASIVIGLGIIYPPGTIVVVLPNPPTDPPTDPVVIPGPITIPPGSLTPTPVGPSGGTSPAPSFKSQKISDACVGAVLSAPTAYPRGVSYDSSTGMLSLESGMFSAPTQSVANEAATNYASQMFDQLKSNGNFQCCVYNVEDMIWAQNSISDCTGGDTFTATGAQSGTMITITTSHIAACSHSNDNGVTASIKALLCVNATSSWLAAGGTNLSIPDPGAVINHAADNLSISCYNENGTAHPGSTLNPGKYFFILTASTAFYEGSKQNGGTMIWTAYLTVTPI